MNKITMVRNIKENRKKDQNERENNWNNCFNAPDKSLLTKNHHTEIPTVIKPTNLRQASSKLKIKTETTYIRIKSASKSSISSNNLPSTPSNGHINPIANNILLKNPIYIQIKALWEVLGITMNYRRMFDNTAIQLSSSYKEGFLGHELSIMQKLQELIQTLKKHITCRQKIIELMKNFDKQITFDSNIQGNPLPEYILSNIIDTIKNLRIETVKIVKQFVKIRKNISYDVLNGKIDLERIKDYDTHYMITMKNDTDFLASSSLGLYFAFAHENDPFLTILSDNKDTKDNNKENELNKGISPPYSVQIDEDLVEPIKECQYIIMQEMISCENKKRYGVLEPSFSSSSLKMPKIINTSHNEIISKKKEIKQIKMIARSPDFKKLNQSNQKDHFITGKMTPLKYEDSKIALEKKYTEKKQLSHSNHCNYIGKNQGNDCIEVQDLIKIDEIINRTIMQKKEIDLKNRQKKNQNKGQNISTINNNQNSSRSSNPNAIENWKSNENDPILMTEEINKPPEEIKDINDIQTHKEQQQVTNNSNICKDFNKEFQGKNLMNYNNDNDSFEPQLVRSNRKIAPDEIYETEVDISKEAIKDYKEGKEYDGYTFNYYTGSIEQLTKIYANYFPKINEDQITAFNISSSINSYFIGIFPKIILVQQNGDHLEGIITFSYDCTSQFVLKLNITSISTLYNNKLKDILLSFIKYCNEAIIYDEMHIDFYYGIKDGQFYQNKSIEDIIKSQAKFKWVNMENDGKIRKINYKLINPILMLSKDSLIKMSLLNKDTIVNVLKIKSCSLISIEKLDECSDAFANTPLMKGENEVNDFALMCLFSEMISKYNYSIVLPILKGLKIDKLRKLSNELVLTQIGVGTEIVEFIQSNLCSLYAKMSSAMLNEYFLCGALMKVDNSFETVISTPIDGIIYNKLELPSIEVFLLKNDNIDKGKADNEQFYLIHSTNENCSLLIYEIIPNGAFSDLLDNTNETEANELRIFQTFKNVYYKIDQQPNETRKTIFLPSFSINKNHFLIKPKSFENISIQNEDSEYVLSKLNQFESISFGGDNSKGMVTFPINDNDIIIKSDFIIAVINHDLLCDLQIPTIAAYIVKKDKWTKCIQA